MLSRKSLRNVLYGVEQESLLLQGTLINERGEVCPVGAGLRHAAKVSDQELHASKTNPTLWASLLKKAKIQEETAEAVFSFVDGIMNTSSETVFKGRILEWLNEQIELVHD